MPTSRGFLVILLLATIACILVVQKSMDGWIVSGNLNFPQLKILNGKKSPIDVFQSSFSAKTLHPKVLENKSMSAEQHSIVNNSMPRNPPNTTEQKTKTLLADGKTTAKIDDSKRKFVENVSETILKKTQKDWTKIDLSQLDMKQSVLVDRHSRLKELLKKNGSPQVKSKHSSLKAVKLLPVVDPKQVTRVFLLTYFRSGSSYVGELLQQNWKTFYQYEPLHYMTSDSRIPDNKTKEVFHLFNSILTCNFTDLNTYFNWVRRSRHQFLFARSLFLWFYCRTEPHLCFSPKFVSTVCERAPIRLIKVTRVHMRQLKSFIKENSDMNVKVIHLLRDPRGIISSRWSLDWCNGRDCSDPQFLCDEMTNDMQVFDEMAAEKPENFLRVKYEDIALNPMNEARRMFNFLGVPSPRSLQRFLRIHTTARKHDNWDPYSTRRNSSSVVFSWRQKLNITQMKTVEDACSDVIQTLNYTFTNFSELDYGVNTNATKNSLSSIRHPVDLQNTSLSFINSVKLSTTKSTQNYTQTYVQKILNNTEGTVP